MRCTTIVLDDQNHSTQVGRVNVVYSLDGRIAWIVPATGSTDNWNHDHEVLAVCEAASNMARAKKAKLVVHTDNKDTCYLTNMRRQGIFQFRESLTEFGCTGTSGYVADLNRVLEFCKAQV